MKKLISVVACCILFVLAVHAEIKISDVTLKMLKDASVAEGKEYLAQRDAIIKKASTGKAGKELMAELKEVAKDKSQPWEIRLMSNICIERIEHGDEINELIHYKWITHPEYVKHRKEWERYLGGPMQFFWPTIVQELKKRKMWFYYLDNTWKKTGEYDMTIPKIRDTSWPGMCKTTLTDSPESYYLFRILEEKIRKEPHMGKYDTQQIYIFLIKHADQTSIKFLLEAWKKSSQDKARYFKYILLQANLEDMDYIREFNKTAEMNHHERAEFNRQLKVLNKKFGLTADGKPASKSQE